MFVYDSQDFPYTKCCFISRFLFITQLLKSACDCKQVFLLTLLFSLTHFQFTNVANHFKNKDTNKVTIQATTASIEVV